MKRARFGCETEYVLGPARSYLPFGGQSMGADWATPIVGVAGQQLEQVPFGQTADAR